MTRPMPMRLTWCLVTALVAGALLMPAPEAFAQEWLVGGSLGQSNAGDYDSSPGDDIDDSSTGWRVFGGYRFMKFFAVELGYLDLGELKASGSSFGGYTDTIGVIGWEIYGRGIWPITDHFELFGDLGLFFWYQDVNYEDASGPFEAKPNGNDVTYAAGANFPLTKRLAVDVEYRWYPNVGDEDESGHVNDDALAAVSLTFSFGK